MKKKSISHVSQWPILIAYKKVPIINCIANYYLIARVHIVKMSARGTSRRFGPVRNSQISPAQQTVPYTTNGLKVAWIITYSFTCRKKTSNDGSSIRSHYTCTVYPFFQEIMTEVKSIHNKIQATQHEQKNMEETKYQLQRHSETKLKCYLKYQNVLIMSVNYTQYIHFNMIVSIKAGLNEDASRNFCENVQRELTSEGCT